MEVVDAPKREAQAEETVVEQVTKALRSLPIGKSLRFEKKRNWSTAAICMRCTSTLLGYRYESFSAKNGDQVDMYITRIG